MRIVACFSAVALFAFVSASAAQEVAADRDICVTEARAMGVEIRAGVSLLPAELGALCVDAAELAQERGNTETARRLRERGVSLLGQTDADSAYRSELYTRAADLARAEQNYAREIELRQAALSAQQADAGAGNISAYPLQAELAGALDRGGRAGDGASLQATATANATQTQARAIAGRRSEYDWETGEHARLLFVTTRPPNTQGASRASAGQGAARYGEAFVNIPRSLVQIAQDRAGASSSHDARRRITFDQEVPFVNRSEFLHELGLATGRAGRGGEVLVFIHGYNTSFQSAVTRAAELGALLEINGAVVVFSWPSAGRLLSYITDGNAAEHDANIRALARLLRDVAEQDETRRVHVVAHSMGNRFLVRALDDLRSVTPLNGRPVLFDEVVFASPDVGRTEFRNVIPRVRHLANRMTIYASDEDRALKISSFLHFADRVGVATPPVSMAETETIDTSGVSVGTYGHDDFSSSARDDLRGVVWQSQQPSRRCVLTTGTTARVWVFRPPPQCSQMAYRVALWYRRHYQDDALQQLDVTIARLQASGGAERLAYHRAARRLLEGWN